VVDEDRVLGLLRSIADDTAVLRQEAGATEERRLDPMWLRGVKYTFVTSIEACVDVAQHICATEGWDPPSCSLPQEPGATCVIIACTVKPCPSRSHD
jgi:uncharacterized protein YutE (UPF0331/DUF86 family)